ncbi:DUF1592 domain-containing protein [Lignipirellula cremea]|uniref:Planctomycete cytochrome C n=1 Tax=Lignipirellula cremea TaxID=2528010 RepID=A0A518DPW7_9BACT|nr:DUF1592 domain-containing protein [Lignipirellula cremea]QDU93882.1 hypothetical protein Pla8534_16670 [Lignipirellula cremea]
MLTRTCPALLLLTLLLFPSVQAAEPATAIAPQAQLEPFLQKYCIGCHGAETQEAEVRFDQPIWEIRNNDVAQRWQDVLDQLNGGTMPPEEEPQPSSAELAGVLDPLTKSLITARRRLTDSGGRIAMRRLNQREYANTIRELFGFEAPLHLIPDDGEAATFDTAGVEQFFTSSHFDKYLELGRAITAEGWEWAAKPRVPSRTLRRESEMNVTQRLRDRLADLDLKMEMKKAGKTWQEMGFQDEGEMRVVFQQFDNRAGKPRRYLQYPQVDQGIYLLSNETLTARSAMNRGAADPRGEYLFRFRAGLVGQPPELRKFVRIVDHEGTVDVVQVRASASEPEVITRRYRPAFDRSTVTLFVEENRVAGTGFYDYLKLADPEGEWASIWLDWAEIEGPFYPQERAFFETLLYPDPPKRSPQKMVWSDENAGELIERFAYEAFRRRQPDADYLQGLVTLFQKNRAAGQTFDQAMSECLAIVLASPGFLYLQEAAEPEGKRRRLDDQELAIRLSYFLWSGPPDAELYACARDGSLSQPAVLHAQVDRLLDDPRAAAFHTGFMSQWAELQRFDAITVDETAFFQFNHGLRFSAYREVLEFFKTLVQENLPASNFIDSDFVVINAALGAHYGLPGVTADGFQKVALPANSPRGGLLGQTAFLTIGSNGERSSPVIRGALVMEKLLHDKPAPPPPNVPELGAATDRPVTNRQMVQLHQRQAVCASCHRKMDVIGFGLENFDTIGAWRDTEKVGRKQVPIESGGTLPGGAAFQNIDDLKSLLLEQEDRLAEELVESLLAYSIGRPMEFSDADAISAILQNLADEDYRLRSMIHEIVSSPLFQTK